MEKILSLKNLDKKFGLVHAVNNLSFDIEKGNVYGILGPNGSGKSTTLGIILNVVNKTSGDYSWFDGKLSTHEALKKVGAIIERPNFYPYMTANQNLKLICKIKGISTDKIDEKLKSVNLYERKDSKFSTFSLGMKQRLAIASALLNDPEILILHVHSIILFLFELQLHGYILFQLHPIGVKLVKSLFHFLQFL